MNRPAAPRDRLLSSSRRKKRALALVVAAAGVLTFIAAERQKPVRVIQLPHLTFAQLDVNFDGDRHQKSSWGEVDLRFIGSERVLYFNLALVAGSSGTAVWRIQNIPVLSREGPGVPQTTTFHFNLGNTPGDRVPFLDYGFALSEATLTEMPAIDLHAHVNRRDYAIDTGYGGNAILFAPPPEALVGGDSARFVGPPEALIGAAAAEGPCSHEGFPNVDVDKDECVPGACSNSLNWMNELYGLGIPVDDISVEAMKTATGWKKENKGSGFGWGELKRQYLEEHGIPVSTEEVDALKVNRILEAVCAGCDVEIGINEHCVAVTGAKKMDNGDYSFDLTHDRDQNGTGGTITETAVYDNVFGRFHGNPWLEEKTLDYIVVECPFGSPTPTATPSETRTRTPSRTPSNTRTPGPESPTATPSATSTATPVTATATPSLTPTPGSPTATPASPTPTPGSPTATPVSPTSTPASTTATPPSATPTT